MNTIIKKSPRVICGFLFASAFVLLALSTSSDAGQRNRAQRLQRNGKVSQTLKVTAVDPTSVPSSGTLNPSGPTQTWTGTVVALDLTDDDTGCVDGVTCDTFTLTLSGTPANWTGKKAHIEITWDPNIGDDFDVIVHKGSNSGPIVGSAFTNASDGKEVVELDPNNIDIGTGTFTVRTIYFFAAPGDTYNGSASAVGVASTPTPTPNPSATPTPTATPPGQPRFQTYQAPPGFGEDAGEPSIGSNWLTENVVRTNQTFANSNGVIPNGGTANYYGGFLTEMLRVTFDDCSSPAKDLWEKKPLTLAATPRAVGDPILHTNHTTGRTFVTQEESQAGATTDVTDNDGDAFSPSQGAGAPAGVDHETIGSGPYAAPTPITVPTYPQAVYYASQSVSDARCSRSDDGGITFGPAVPMYTIADCDGLHGHVKVAPDGTVYVPDKQCAVAGVPLVLGGNASAIVSTDNGLTWNIRPIPGTAGAGYGEWDPSIGVATDGTIYLGFQGIADYGSGKTGTPAKISVSHDKGVTWSTPVDVGAQLGIKNMVFPTVVAGDPNRAAFVFYGTTTADCASCSPVEDHTGGSNNDPTLFDGNWYLFVATTYDGGATWTTQNVTPGDPVQRGPICGDSTCRNLLDFFDATIDKRGRVLVGWEDGCIASCVNGPPNSFTAKATISRQSGGKRMFSVYDPVEPALAGAPRLSGYLNGTQSAIELSWPAPDNGGSTITSYKVYRRVAPAGSFTLIGTTNVPNFHDGSGFSTDVTKDFYRVTAVNGQGEGPYCDGFNPSPTPPPTPCVLPGIMAVNDLNPDGTDADSGQNTPVDGSVNVKELFVAEPFVVGGDRLYFTLQVAPSVLGMAPPNSQWLIIWNRQGNDPSDPSDASFDRIYIGMRTDATGTPSFEYGKFGVPLNTSVPPVQDPNANTPVKKGDADAGSSYNPLTGEIRIIVTSDKLRAIDGGPTKYKAGSGLAGLNVRTYFNRPDPGQRSQNNASDITSDNSYILAGNNSCATAPTLVSAVSRKVHGAAGTFDVKLVPPDQNSGIECRSGGANSAYQVVMSFAAPVTYSGITTSAGSVAGSSNAGSVVTVNLTGVPNAQVTNITLLGASTGGATADITVPLKVLIGDTTGNGLVNSGDISQTQNQSGQPVNGEEGTDNFREDVTVNGAINSADISLVQQKSGTGLP
jgi:hypothetical protein